MATVIIVMFLMGILGGVIGHLLSRDETNVRYSQSIVIGIGASLLVPLFLNMISSNLVDSILGNGLVWNAKLLVFAGFCLVAAISSRAFIRTLSDKILQLAKEAKQEAKEVKQEVREMQQVVEPIVQKETEISPVDNEQTASAASVKLSGDELAVLRALTDPSYTYRSISGIVGSTGLDEQLVNNLLLDLASRGYVGRPKSETQGTKAARWFATGLGRDQVARQDERKAGT